MVDTLETVDKNVKETIMGDPLKIKTASVYTDDEI